MHIDISGTDALILVIGKEKWYDKIQIEVVCRKKG